MITLDDIKIISDSFEKGLIPDDFLPKIKEKILEKAKYIRREGSPGNYKYIYEEGSKGKGKKESEKEGSGKKEETKEEKHQKAIKLIQELQSSIGDKFNINFGEGRGFSGMSLYANIRGKKYRISDHGVSNKWAEVYGYPDESFVISEFNEEEWGKIKKDVFNKIENDLKKPEKYEQIEYTVLKPLFSGANDIKTGEYILPGQRGDDKKVKIKKVGGDSSIVNINGIDKEIKNKFILNWEKKEKRIKKTPLTDYKK